jgi:tetratricopeptide (TPR) repeat protein
VAQFNPFPGLRPFEPDEEHLFFGREAETDELLRRLRSTRFLAVIGSSGSGKSSLVRSGLIPSLQGGFMVSAGSSWRMAILRPGEDPIGHLAVALNGANVGTTSEDEDVASTSTILIESSLRRGSLGLVEAVRIARLPRDQNILVVVDQFEELFRYRRSHQIHNSRGEAIAFVRLLLAAAQQQALPIYVVLTMRSDFISECMHFPGLSDAVNSGLYLVGRMGRDALRAAITGPVAVAGGTIAPRLVHRVLNDLGDDHDQLPLVQHALMRTWDHWATTRGAGTPVDIEDYEAVGGFHRALSQHAEEAYADAVASGGAQITERIFKALTDTVSDVGVRRPTAIGELAPICDATEEEVATVVEVFRRSGRSFLMPPPGVPLTSRSIIDLSHESLMRCWTRLIRWADEERSAAGFYERLAQAAVWYEQGTAGLWRNPELELAQRWKAKTRPSAAWALRYAEGFDQAMAFLDKSQQEQDRVEREREHERKAKLRRAQWAAAVLGAFLVIALVLGGLAWRENLRAELNLALARAAVDESLTTAERDPASMGADMPEMEQFRRELLEKARRFYATFMDQDPRSETSRRDIVQAHYRLGHIDRLLQKPEEAQKQYRTAIAGFEGLSTDYPEQPEYRQGLANAFNWLAETLRPLPLQAEEAQRAYDSALKVQRALVQQYPGTAIYRRELARTLYNRGILRWSAEQAPLAESDFRESIALLEPLAAADPRAAQELARAYNNLASLRMTDDPGEAETLYQRAIDTDERLVAEYPENREYKLELSKYHNNFAALLHERNQGTRAAAQSERALALIEELSRLAPSLAIERADAYNLHAMVLQPQAPATAAREYQEALDLFTQLRRDPAAVGLPEFHQRLGDLLLNLAAFLERTSSVDVGRDLSRAVALYADVAAAAIASGSRAQGQLVANTLASVLPDLPEVHQRRLKPLYEQLQTSQMPGSR